MPEGAAAPRRRAVPFRRPSGSVALVTPPVLRLAELYWRTVAHAVARRRLAAPATSSGPARPAAPHALLETAINTAVALLRFEWVSLVLEGAATLGRCAVPTKWLAAVFRAR